MTRQAGAPSFEGRAMGSPLRLTMVGVSRRMAARAWAVVQADVEATERSISRWRADSALSVLNRVAGSGSGRVDRRLAGLLVASARAQRLSAGRFDPRVVARLEALGERAGVPLPLPRDDAETGSSGPWLRLDPHRGVAELAAPVDSGGIGKGLALRWAVRALRRAGTVGEGLLLEAGGDLICVGRAPQDGPWQIGIEDPGGSGRPLAAIATTDAAVATSSIAVRTWTAPGGRQVHHLIDPITGEPGGEGLTAVTVAAADPAWAEVWSKTLFLAGRRRIGDEARHRGLAAWWVEADGSLHLSPTARTLTSWSLADRAA
jgi:thiamine biosynthesis lipoprotein